MGIYPGCLANGPTASCCSLMTAACSHFVNEFIKTSPCEFVDEEIFDVYKVIPFNCFQFCASIFWVSVFPLESKKPSLV